ncbi:hypothetical protein MLQ51_25475, partial [Escherichia coli]|nr:hypothetical protein [Escherichia coli]
RAAETGDTGAGGGGRLSARAKTPGRLTPAGNAGCSAAALPARLSGQKVVYGCMQGTGVIFRDTVTVSGCLLLRP